MPKAISAQSNNDEQIVYPRMLGNSLEANIQIFRGIFKDNETLVIRRFQNRFLKEAKCCILFFEGMVNIEIINENIIEPILSNNLKEDIDTTNLLEEIQNKVIITSKLKIETDVNKILPDIIYGDTLFMVEGYDQALLISTKGWKARSISEPESEKVVRGPREGFNESIMQNLSLVRRKIKNPNLKMRFKEIGTQTLTKTCICYIEGLALEGVLKELEKRLDGIAIDSVLDSGYIQELIRDEPMSPFETVGYSERPDVVASKLLEGRVALFVDGSPTVLTVPYVLAESSQASEDYYNNYIFSSINRFIRTMSAILCITIPALYQAITTYHQEMIPTPLLLSISASREGVPFPTVLSMSAMLLIFDILREAGTRMPTPIGQAVNIVGSLVLGQAAVEAKLVSAPIVIITALTGILTLMNISLIGSVIVYRFFLILMASVLGLYGVLFGFISIIIHLSNMRSFGVPYMLNITSVKDHNGQDVWIRAPWWSMTLRPKIIGVRNMVRQKVQKVRR
jgi:spore germination protein KA